MNIITYKIFNKLLSEQLSDCDYQITRLKIFEITKDVRQCELKVQIHTLENALSITIGAPFQIQKNEHNRLQTLLSKMRLKWRGNYRKVEKFQEENKEWLNVVETVKVSIIE